MCSQIPLIVFSPCVATVSSSSGQSESSTSAAAIGGAVGGTILFVIVAVLLIVMLWWSSHKKKADNNYLKENICNTVELGSNKTTTKKMKEGEIELDHVQTNESAPHPGTDSKATVKMTTNPSYDSATNMNIKMTTNPSYGSTNKPVSTGDYDYVLDHSILHPKVNNIPTQDLLHPNTSPDVAIKMEANPSYGLTVQDTKTNMAGVKNDYDYIDDGLIQHPSHLPVNTDQGATETNEGEYGVVNQPMSDSFSPGTLGRMISEDKGSAGNQSMSDNGTKYKNNM